MSRAAAVLFLICASLFHIAQPAAAQNCPSKPEARILESQRDPFGTYCLRVLQAEFARQKCDRARSAIDLDECQYLSANLVRDLRSCAALGGPFGAKCAAMVGQGQEMLGAVAGNPVLQQHREEQREGERYSNGCRGAIGAQCMGQCGNDLTCVASCNSNNAYRCNR